MMNLLFPLSLIGLGLYLAARKSTAAEPDVPQPLPAEPEEPEEPEPHEELPTEPEIPNPFPQPDKPYSQQNVYARYCEYLHGDYDTTNGGCLLPDGRKVDGARLYNGEIEKMPGGKGWFE